MSTLYGTNQRTLQDRFDTRRLADKVEQLVVQPEVSDMDKAFIESRDMFWLSTIDDQGRPTVSYKGGDPVFVKVVDGKTIAFPLYDGNGMFYSAGNIMGNGKVGLLFMNFETPQRIRVQGLASVRENDPLMGQFVEAQMVVRVSVTEVWPNCPRYVHRYQKVMASRYCATRPMRDAPRRLEAHRPDSGRSPGKGSGQGGQGRRFAQHGGMVRQTCARQPGGLRSGSS